MLEKLIQQMKEQGLISVAPLALRGRAKPVLTFLALMTETETYRPDEEQWNYLEQRMNRDGGSTC